MEQSVQEVRRCWSMNKYLKLWLKTFSMELSSDLAYKTNFIIRSFALIMADFIGPVIIILIYGASSGIPGWKFEEFILFQGTFILVTGLSHAFLYLIPIIVIENVRDGSFDKILTKPFNPLLYLTFSSIDIEGFAEVFTGLALIIWAFLKLNIAASFNLMIYIIIIFLALVFMYSLMIIISSLAFLFIKSYALFELLFKILDVGRYPMSIYGFEMKFIFTFLIPVAVVSFYPASALLGALDIIKLFEIIIPIGIFMILSIVIWNVSIKKYTSAGG